MRAGYLGALAAWIGFTLPSAVALVLFAYGAGALSGPIGTGLLHGLKLTAVAVGLCARLPGRARRLDRLHLPSAVALVLFAYGAGALAVRRDRAAAWIETDGG